MSDYGLRAIAKAIKFVGLCLFFGLTLQGKSFSQGMTDAIQKEYRHE